MERIRIIVAATNDLATDQRLKRHCDTLYAGGYDILLTGRLLPGSLPLDDRPYKTRRVKHWFNKGFLFYAETNARLFVFLLFTSFDILNSNDLDTLPACYLASRLKRKALVYDSHEYFTEVPELNNRKLVKRTWEKIECSIFPKLRNIITVNQRIAGAYHAKYGKEIHIVRNLPERIVIKGPDSLAAYGIPGDKKAVILQGSGINRDRGAEEAIDAISQVENVVLIIAGSGDMIPALKQRVAEKHLQDRVIFIPLMPYSRLMGLTRLCDAGLSLDKGTSLNYRYSLPNKLFDYIMAGIPVVASPLPEVRKIVEGYGTGVLIKSHAPEEIAEKINTVLYIKPKTKWKGALDKAAGELNWDHEKHKLLDIYNLLRKTGS